MRLNVYALCMALLAGTLLVSSGCKSGAGGQVVSHVASDNLAGGRLAAEFIVKALNGQGEVGIIGQ